MKYSLVWCIIISLTGYNMAINMGCNCEWHKVIATISDESNKLLMKLNINDFRSYGNILMFIVAKYGQDYFDKFNKKCDEYFNAMLDDAPYDYGIFDNNIGCHFELFLNYKFDAICNKNLSEKIVSKRLSIPTLQNMLNHHININKLNVFEIFQQCVSNDYMDYFAMLIDGFPNLKKIIDVSMLTDYLLQIEYKTNTDNTDKPDKQIIEIINVMCKVFGKDNILYSFKKSRGHGHFPKTAKVFDNFKKYEAIINYNTIVSG